MDVGFSVLIKLGSQQQPLDSGSGVFANVVKITLAGSAVAVPLCLLRSAISAVKMSLKPLGSPRCFFPRSFRHFHLFLLF